ncbi:MAG: hypothetical protein ACREE0_19190 [Phenylobacterium sp.]
MKGALSAFQDAANLRAQFARSLSARFVVASMSAFFEDGMPQRTSRNSRVPPAALVTMGAA